MTCIVGVVDEKESVIGADRAGTAGHIVQEYQPKIIKRDGYLIGVTGSYRVHQIIEQHWCWKIFNHTNVLEIIKEFRLMLKEHGALKVNHEIESMEEAQIMIVHRNGISTIYQDFAVMEPKEQVIGSGWEVALGALYATRHLSALTRVNVALEAAAEYVTEVSPPFDVEILKW